MAPFAHLELGLHRFVDSGYHVELRFHEPNSDTDIAPVLEPVSLDLNLLEQEQNTNPVGYGHLLSQQLFTPAVAKVFSDYQKITEVAQAILRLRLFIGPSAPELNNVRWETLCDPSGLNLTTNQNIYFSRYLASDDMQPVLPLERTQLRVLVLIAAPTNISGLQIDVSSELARAKDALKDISTPLTVLAPQGLGADDPTLNNLVNHQAEEAYQIIYIVCHGAKIDGEAKL